MQPKSIEVINKCDTIVELSSLETLTLVSQRVQQIHNLEDIAVEISVLIGSRDFIVDVAQERTKLLAKQRATECEKDRTHAEMVAQQNVLAELI